MNKTQLIDALSTRYEGNKKQAQHALESVLDVITREVAKGEKVAITGFGSFEKRVREARWVRNPRTGDRVKAKKTAVPKFTAGADLKAVVSGAKKLPKPAGGCRRREEVGTGQDRGCGGQEGDGSREEGRCGREEVGTRQEGVDGEEGDGQEVGTGEEDGGEEDLDGEEDHREEVGTGEEDCGEEDLDGEEGHRQEVGTGEEDRGEEDHDSQEGTGQEGRGAKKSAPAKKAPAKRAAKKS